MKEEEPDRPDPDELLSRIAVEESKARRGRLKVFFGSSAGVGKTYAMLSAAREQLEQGRNVLGGIIETHGRPETEKLLEGLLILQPLEIPYRGLRLKELDIDTALTRKPDILLVDELAHTNAAGCRHPKRWNDVQEVLDAGIDVYTTLNVQHLESLSDLVAGTTGIWMKETVPDALFDSAEDVVLVDIDEDDLLRRLSEGKVYLAPGAKAHAAENFFRKNNLSALRELALRRMAERVDAEREANAPYDEKIALSDKILVAVALEPMAVKLIRSGRRMATALKAPWTVLHIDASQGARLPEDKARRLEALERMVERMGGKMVVVRAEDIAEEIVSYARRAHISKIVVGKNVRRSFRACTGDVLLDRILRKSRSIDIYVVTDERLKEREALHLPAFIRSSSLLDYVLTLLTLAGFTIPGFALPDLLTATDQALLYLTGIVVVAGQLGLGPSLLYACLATVSFYLFFIGGTSHIFSSADKSYLITLVVMLTAGVTIARQASRLRAQAASSREREGRTRSLYALTRKLAASRGRFPVSEVAGSYIAQTFDVNATVWMTNSEGHPSVILGSLPEETYYKDFGALQWSFDNEQNAGRGTETMPSAAGFYLPLLSGGGRLGVLGVFPKEERRVFTGEEISSLETVASLLASALERVRAGEIASQIMVEKESAKLRASLLAGARATAGGKTGSLPPLRDVHLEQMMCALRPESQTPQAAAPTLRLEADLSAFFGAQGEKSEIAALNRRPTSLLERVRRVVDRLAPFPEGKKIETAIGTDLPDILADQSLIEQALSDLFLFALARSPAGGAVRIEAQRLQSDLLLTLADQGAPLPPESLGKLFDSFATPTRSAAPDAPPPSASLSIAANILRLHGGAIEAENLQKNGFKISLSLPIA